MRTPKPPALQVLFEPFPDGDTPWDRDGCEAFAGTYFFDALDAEGRFIDRGYRAVLSGCTVCRRHDDNPRQHWDIANDMPQFGKPKVRHCGTWKTVEKIAKAFGGWQRVHYVELAEYEGLQYQPIPQRRRAVEACAVCDGSGFMQGWEQLTPLPWTIPPCAAGCGSYTYRGRGEVQVTYEGPVRPDRHGMTATQLRKR